MQVKRTNIILKPDSGRVLLRPFEIKDKSRVARIIGRVLSLTEEQTARQLRHVLAEFEQRHRNIRQFWLTRFEQVYRARTGELPLSESRKLLVGSYFTHEYSLESAALFNPSMVWHPDQTGLPRGSRRFILSLRATGEGHISSLTFRTGTIDSDCNVVMEPGSKLATGPTMTTTTEVGYEISFSSDCPLPERTIFPLTLLERNGIEDARFVEFHGEESAIYYATYTAYDGKTIHPVLLETKDFVHFKNRVLTGPEAKNKGMALFPRKIKDHYAMLSRQDNENNFLMYATDIHCWKEKETISTPSRPWEFVQLGNCGSPLETAAGWLVLTHGVGPMRKYVISAILLDLQDPAKMIGRLQEPLLWPDEQEREGYVPNVVYSCGGLIHGRTLILPYATSDSASSFAVINLDELLTELQDS